MSSIVIDTGRFTEVSTGGEARKPYSGAVPVPEVTAIDFTALPGYDAGETQSLKSVSGVLQWVTDEAEEP